MNYLAHSIMINEQTLLPYQVSEMRSHGMSSYILLVQAKNTIKRLLPYMKILYIAISLYCCVSLINRLSS